MSTREPCGDAFADDPHWLGTVGAKAQEWYEDAAENQHSMSPVDKVRVIELSRFVADLVAAVRSRDATIQRVRDLDGTHVVPVKGPNDTWPLVVVWKHVEAALDPTESEGGGVQ